MCEMKKLQNFKITRCLQPEGVTGSPQLHGFSDGGNDVYLFVGPHQVEYRLDLLLLRLL